MVTLTAATTFPERIAHCEKAHTIRVLSEATGGYRVSCMDCDWWSTIPAGKRLRGGTNRGAIHRRYRNGWRSVRVKTGKREPVSR